MNLLCAALDCEPELCVEDRNRALRLKDLEREAVSKVGKLSQGIHSLKERA